jgi:hypothetical protein
MVEAEISRANRPLEWQSSRAGIYNMTAGKRIKPASSRVDLVFRATHLID